MFYVFFRFLSILLFLLYRNWCESPLRLGIFSIELFVFILQVLSSFASPVCAKLLTNSNMLSRLEECVKTANANFLLAYFYKMWVFGAIYYWSNWLFVSIFLAGLVFRCARGRPKATDAHFQREYDSEDEDNEMSEDNDPLLPAFRP